MSWSPKPFASFSLAGWVYPPALWQYHAYFSRPGSS